MGREEKPGHSDGRQTTGISRTVFGFDDDQYVEQDMDGGQEVNDRQRRVGDEYAMGGICLQSFLPPPKLRA
jgi:hypothetical protein